VRIRRMGHKRLSSARGPVTEKVRKSDNLRGRANDRIEPSVEVKNLRCERS
jgi:hypothetical protein